MLGEINVLLIFVVIVKLRKTKSQECLLMTGFQFQSLSGLGGVHGYDGLVLKFLQIFRHHRIDEQSLGRIQLWEITSFVGCQ